ncbi:UNVERIFIED_CONTAM: hypothetical protein FKN15_063613 [Acipenser sinensis]
MLYFQLVIMAGTVLLAYYFECTDTFGVHIQGFFCNDADLMKPYPGVEDESFIPPLVLYCVVAAAPTAIMYITSTIKTKSSRLAKPVLCLGTLCAAFLTGLNRVSEYRNHCSDVIAGFILGSAVALFLACITKCMPVVITKCMPVVMSRNVYPCPCHEMLPVVMLRNASHGHVTKCCPWSQQAMHACSLVTKCIPVVMSRNAARGHVTKCCPWPCHEMLPVAMSRNAARGHVTKCCPWPCHEMLPVAMSRNAARGHVTKCCPWPCHEMLPVAMSRNAARGHVTKCCPWSCYEMLPTVMLRNAARGHVTKCCP